MANERPFILRWRSAVLNSTETTSTKISLLALAEFANKDGEDAIPGFPALAAKSSLNERTCRRAIDQAEDRWFTRTPIKLVGKDWRAYAYTLRLPEGADTTPAGKRNGAGTVSGANEGRSGHSRTKVRTLTPEGAGTVSAVLGRAPRKKQLGRGKAPLLTFVEWKKQLPEGERVIPLDDPVFAYVDDAGIPEHVHYLAWIAFKERFENSSETCDDWRARYRRAIQENWFKLWWFDENNEEWALTNAGKAMQFVVEARE